MEFKVGDIVVATSHDLNSQYRNKQFEIEVIEEGYIWFTKTGYTDNFYLTAKDWGLRHVTPLEELL